MKQFLSVMMNQQDALLIWQLLKIFITVLHITGKSRHPFPSSNRTVNVGELTSAVNWIIEEMNIQKQSEKKP